MQDQGLNQALRRPAMDHHQMEVPVHNRKAGHGCHLPVPDSTMRLTKSARGAKRATDSLSRTSPVPFTCGLFTFEVVVVLFFSYVLR